MTTERRARCSPCRLFGGLPRARKIAFLLLVNALPLFGSYDVSLQYQDRGNRYEGIKPNLVSDSDVELRSAVVDYREPGSSWPATLRLRFYLPGNKPVFVTVREPQPKAYYWLDRIAPSSRWRPEAVNEFAWPTDTVLRRIPALTMNDLGVVVRLDSSDPSKEETIAPAVLFSTLPPRTSNAYRFVFKTNASARLSCWISRGGRRAYQWPQIRAIADIPFTLLWKAEGNPDGEYRLRLEGTFDDHDHTPLAKEVVFYHRASW
jgi:hypothetical protein